MSNQISDKVIEVTNLVEDERADKFLANYFQTDDIETLSRAEIQRYFDDGKVEVNNKIIKPSFKVKNGDVIVMKSRIFIPSELIKENIPLDIVYEDNDVIVVNKPSGMVVHPAAGHESGTLVNAILYHSDSLSDINGSYRPGIVHRIDKDTSGLLIVCKNNYSHKKIAEQLRNKTSKREYIAIVCGIIEHNYGKINAPIGRDPNNRQKNAVVEGGKESVTHFTVLERLKGYTLISLRLETGRTHQIRVHMAYIGHPVLGDPLYGPKKLIDENGQYLHARMIGFVHPTTGEYLEFECELPDFFKKKIDELK